MEDQNDLNYEVDEESKMYEDKEVEEDEEDEKDDDYSHDRDNAKRKEIAKIFDTLVQDTPFDPFDYPDQLEGYESFTLTLFNGLPHENLKYLLSQDSHLINASDCFVLIYENLLVLDDTVDDFQNCVDLLLTKYEAMRQDLVTCKEWHHRVKILQIFLSQWIFEITNISGAELKISRCLTLTEDLYRNDGLGTPLDLIARLVPEKVGSWLELLTRNGIDISEYLQYEYDKHPDKIVYQGRYQCCRKIFLHFQQGESGISGVEVDNVCDPQYEHFHPEYRCETGRSRERCITKFPDIMIDEDGRPSQPVPGSWLGALKSNSESFLVFQTGWIGLQYVDFLGANGYFWDETTERWK